MHVLSKKTVYMYVGKGQIAGQEGNEGYNSGEMVDGRNAGQEGSVKVRMDRNSGKGRLQDMKE